MKSIMQNWLHSEPTVGAWTSVGFSLLVCLFIHWFTGQLFTEHLS